MTVWLIGTFFLSFVGLFFSWLMPILLWFMFPLTNPNNVRWDTISIPKQTLAAIEGRRRKKRGPCKTYNRFDWFRVHNVRAIARVPIFHPVSSNQSGCFRLSIGEVKNWHAKPNIDAASWKTEITEIYIYLDIRIGRERERKETGSQEAKRWRWTCYEYVIA